MEREREGERGRESESDVICRFERREIDGNVVGGGGGGGGRR